MADFKKIRALIKETIKLNLSYEITAERLKDMLLQFVSAEQYSFEGILDPTLVPPPMPDYRAYYLCLQSGNYLNTIVPRWHFGILTNVNSTSTPPVASWKMNVYRVKYSPLEDQTSSIILYTEMYPKNLDVVLNIDPFNRTLIKHQGLFAVYENLKKVKNYIGTECRTDAYQVAWLDPQGNDAPLSDVRYLVYIKEDGMIYVVHNELMNEIADELDYSSHSEPPLLVLGHFREAQGHFDTSFHGRLRYRQVTYVNGVAHSGNANFLKKESQHLPLPIVMNFTIHGTEIIPKEHRVVIDLDTLDSKFFIRTPYKVFSSEYNPSTAYAIFDNCLFSGFEPTDIYKKTYPEINQDTVYEPWYVCIGQPDDTAAYGLCIVAESYIGYLSKKPGFYLCGYFKLDPNFTDPSIMGGCLNMQWKISYGGTNVSYVYNCRSYKHYEQYTDRYGVAAISRMTLPAFEAPPNLIRNVIFSFGAASIENPVPTKISLSANVSFPADIDLTQLQVPNQTGFIIVKGWSGFDFVDERWEDINNEKLICSLNPNIASEYDIEILAVAEINLMTTSLTFFDYTTWGCHAKITFTVLYQGIPYTAESEFIPIIPIQVPVAIDVNSSSSLFIETSGYWQLLTAIPYFMPIMTEYNVYAGITWLDEDGIVYNTYSLPDDFDKENCGFNTDLLDATGGNESNGNFLVNDLESYIPPKAIWWCLNLRWYELKLYPERTIEIDTAKPEEGAKLSDTELGITPFVIKCFQRIPTFYNDLFGAYPIFILKSFDPTALGQCAVSMCDEFDKVLFVVKTKYTFYESQTYGGFSDPIFTKETEVNDFKGGFEEYISMPLKDQFQTDQDYAVWVVSEITYKDIIDHKIQDEISHYKHISPLYRDSVSSDYNWGQLYLGVLAVINSQFYTVAVNYYVGVAPLVYIYISLVRLLILEENSGIHDVKEIFIEKCLLARRSKQEIDGTESFEVPEEFIPTMKNKNRIYYQIEYYYEDRAGFKTYTFITPYAEIAIEGDIDNSPVEKMKLNTKKITYGKLQLAKKGIV